MQNDDPRCNGFFILDAYGFFFGNTDAFENFYWTIDTEMKTLMGPELI